MQPQASTTPARNAYKWWVMLTVGVGIFMTTLDMSSVNVSLPTIAQSLQASLNRMSWVVMSYFLTIAALLLTMGRLGDMLGRKLLYIWGYATFTCGSLLSAFSGNLIQLVLYRGIQGVGAAMMMATAPAIITETFDPRERGKAFGMFSTIQSLGVTVGPAMGGWLVGMAGWRAIFLANFPLGLAGTLLAITILKGGKTSSFSMKQFDLGGSLLLFLTLLSLLLTLNQGREGGLGSALFLGLGLMSLLCLAAFLTAAHHAPAPLIPLSIFRNRRFSLACASFLLGVLSLFGGQFLHPFFQQQVFAFPPARTGRILITVPLSIALVSPISGWWSDRIGARFLCPLGLAIACLGYIGLSTLGPDAGTIGWVLRLALVGLGMGIFQAPNNSTIMGALATNQVGTAAGVMSSVRVLGSIMGVALVGTIYTSSEAHYLGQLMASTGKGGRVAALTLAFHNAYLIPAMACLIGVILALGMGTDRNRAARRN